MTPFDLPNVIVIDASKCPICGLAQLDCKHYKGTWGADQVQDVAPGRRITHIVQRTKYECDLYRATNLAFDVSSEQDGVIFASDDLEEAYQRYLLECELLMIRANDSEYGYLVNGNWNYFGITPMWYANISMHRNVQSYQWPLDLAPRAQYDLKQKADKLGARFELRRLS